jgi:hypothetical protein
MNYHLLIPQDGQKTNLIYCLNGFEVVSLTRVLNKTEKYVLEFMQLRNLLISSLDRRRRCTKNRRPDNRGPTVCIISIPVSMCRYVLPNRTLISFTETTNR